ncbi:uncharacterized protein PHALS_08956 [Plasmopara halstedii]|uniref:Transmembrane protein n=1 Tax=Plasmopara halstedii TaxID=4781 RepID=A0A0P1AEL8_PLAHL|nr:uncharacterized protein PHALS_08956 [Plasmopara halstedii]CEG38910.1 hypothetical protein PHALS_08956 [Plasmopara halstedii]|eukprot:XP_024575279.1 hypothetical protein PHALS_08956 [Plasmopara halstedii]
MLTRSRSKASNQPVFIDDNWNDAYIQAKDEQIDALLAADASQRGWDELEEENSEADEDDSDEDAWHSDSDESTDNDEDWFEKPQQNSEWNFAQRWVAGDGLLQNIGWTLAVLSVAPMLLYVTLPRNEQQLWPLHSLSLAGTLTKVLLNLLTLVAAAVTLYGFIRNVNPLDTINALNWRQIELELPVQLLQRGREYVKEVMEVFTVELDPSTPLRSYIWTLMTTLDTPGIHFLTALLAGVLVTLTCFYRVWAKTLVLLGTVAYVTYNVVTEMKMHQQTAVGIFSLDPDFAFVNETIFVAIDGQNLEDGGSIAWAPYWGGVQQRRAQICPKLFPQRLSNGGVLVTFDRMNEYVPCYLSPKEASSAIIVDSEIQSSESSQCFESIRLRVKDQKSVPGWSLQNHKQI